MPRTARTAEFDYYQRNRTLGARFLPMLEARLRAFLEATLAAIGEEDVAADQHGVPVEAETNVEIKLPPRPVKAVVVRALNPRPRRH